MHVIFAGRVFHVCRCGCGVNIQRELFVAVWYLSIQEIRSGKYYLLDEVRQTAAALPVNPILCCNFKGLHTVSDIKTAITNA